MRLVLRRQPGPDTLVQQDVLRVERLELRVLRCPNLLRNKVVCPQVQTQTNDTHRAHPQARHRHKQHEEVQPALVRKRNPEDLRPETVRRHHRVRLFCLRRVERPEGVRVLAILKQRVLHRRSVDRAQQCTPQNASHSHHVEGVQGPVVEPLEEQQEAENRCYTKARCKKPARLTQRVHQKHRHKHCNRRAEGDRVVRTNAHQSRNLKLTQHEPDQPEGSVQGDEGPQTSQLAPADKVPLGLRSPQKQQGVSQAVGRCRHRYSQKVASFQVGRCQPVGVPRAYEGGPRQPSPNRQVGAGEQQQTRPPNEHKPIALQPVVENVKPSSLGLCASDCDGHSANLQIL